MRSMQRQNSGLVASFRDPRWRTTVLINLAAVVEKADEQVLPAVYYFISRSLNASPSQLGTLTLCRALVQALASPLSGLIGDKADRTKVVAAGCLLWGIMTSAIGLCTTMTQAMVACGFNGLGLALVIPCLQSLTADFHPADQRGRAFGVMFCVSSVGGMFGGFFATNVGSMFIMGIDGWRLAFHTMAAVALVTVYLVLKFAVDPRPRAVISPLQLGDERQRGETYSSLALDEDPSAKTGEPSARLQRTLSGRGQLPVGRRPPPDIHARLAEAVSDIKHVMGIPTFRIIVLQGIVGSLPWQAMVFFTVWLQLLGFSDLAASTLMAVFALGTAFGQILGGSVGDRLAKQFPNTGRVVTAQVSVFTGLPLCWLLLRVLPTLDDPPAAGWAFAAVFGVMGALITWPGPSNSAIMADVTPEPLRSTVFAFDRSFEGGVAATAAPLVGLIAERVFGFQGAVAGGDPTSEGDLGRRQNAHALSLSLFVCMLIPWCACFLSYFGAHWTFPRDKAKANRYNKRQSRGSESDLQALAAYPPTIRRRPSEILLAEQATRQE